MNNVHFYKIRSIRLWEWRKETFTILSKFTISRNEELPECFRLIFLLWSSSFQKCLLKTWINKLNRAFHIVFRPSHLTPSVLYLPWKEPLQLDEFHFIRKRKWNLFHLHSDVALKRLVMSFIYVFCMFIRLFFLIFRVSENYIIIIRMAKVMGIHPESTLILLSIFLNLRLVIWWANNRILDRLMCHSHIRPEQDLFININALS